MGWSKGAPSPFKGRHHSEASNLKNRLGHLGKPSWNKGLAWSGESKNKMSQSHRGKRTWSKGKSFDNHYRRKLSEAHIGKLPWNKGTHGLLTPWNKGVILGPKASNWKGRYAASRLRMKEKRRGLHPVGIVLNQKFQGSHLHHTEVLDPSTGKYYGIYLPATLNRNHCALPGKENRLDIVNYDAIEFLIQELTQQSS